ncbi:unnamed protein product [Cuscuta epithymum]|uniref:Uncharacterized protein n=2 Tax=Cuscuta epithymum TaxID=186058 RepID=A0AAV0G777_9ASTE|nr:unnamed protein product [Cuscuta epithymum]
MNPNPTKGIDSKEFAPPNPKRRDNKSILTHNEDDEEEDKYDEEFVFETTGGDDYKGLESIVNESTPNGSEADKRIHSLKKLQNLHYEHAKSNPNFHGKMRIKAVIARDAVVVMSVMTFIS